MSERGKVGSEKDSKIVKEPIAGEVKEKKKVEEALLSCEEKYHTFFEDSKDALYITTRGGKFVDVNQSMLELLGYTRDEILALDVSQFYVHPENRLNFQQKIEQDESVRDYELKLRKKDGNEIDCLLTSTVRRAKDGSILGYEGIIRDISYQKHMEGELQRERKAFHIIAEAAVHATDIPNLCHRILKGLVTTLAFDFGTVRLYNEKEQILQPTAVFGLSEEIVQKKISSQSLNDKRHLAALVARTRQAIFAPDVSKHEILKTHEFRLNELGVRSMISWPIISAGQNLLGVIHLMAHKPKIIAEDDRTFFATVAGLLATALERKQAEEKIKDYAENLEKLFNQRTKALSESEAKLQAILAGIGAFITIQNEDLEIIWQNQPAKKMWGDLVGKKCYEEYKGFSEPCPGCSVERVFKEKKTLISEKVSILSDGTPRNVLVASSPIRDDDGNIIAVVEVNTDITEKKKLEKKIIESEERYRGLYESSKDGIASVDIEGRILECNQAFADTLRRIYLI